MKDMEVHHLENVWIQMERLEILMKYNHLVFNVCFPFFSSLFLSNLNFLPFFKKKVPEPVSTIQVIAKSDSVIISWDIPMRATKYHVYLIVQETLIPINDGAGLDVSTNHVTIHSVFFFF